MTDVALAQTLLLRLDDESPAEALNAMNACRRICAAQGAPLYLVGGSVRDLLLGPARLRHRPDDRGRRGADRAAGGRGDRRTSGNPRAVRHRQGLRTWLSPRPRRGAPRELSATGLPAGRRARDAGGRPGTPRLHDQRHRPAPGASAGRRSSIPFRGVADTRSSLVRVLHERSFQDDATRMLRAVRYAARLDFKIATQTAALIRRDLSYLGHDQRATPAKGPGAAVRRDLGCRRALGWRSISASSKRSIRRWGYPKKVATRWQDALAGPKLAPLDELGFCVVADPKDEGTAASVSKWLHLAGRVEQALQRPRAPAIAIA